MSSEESTFSSLSIDPFQVDEDAEENLDLIWKTLFDSLPTITTVVDSENALHTIQSSIDRYLRWCICAEDAETRFLQYVAPVLAHVFKHNLGQTKESTESLNSENLEGIKQHLKVCVNVLDIIIDAIVHIVSWDAVDITQIESLPKTVANILLNSYKHCKESETVYGSIFSNLIVELTDLFRKTSELNFKLLLLLNGVVVYEDPGCNVLLTEVLNTLTLVGEVVVSLDLKTMAEHWKGFMKLLQTNVAKLESFNIQRPVMFLAGCVENILKEITDPKIKDSKTINRPLKEGSFELKLIIKLCESFTENLNNCIPTLIDLIIVLHDYSAPCLNSQNVSLEVIDSIESHLIIGTESLFITAIKNQTFIENYFQKYETVLQNGQNKIGFIFLTTSILKHFTKMPLEEKHIWLLNDDKNIFKTIFQLISNCHAELCLDMKIPIRNDIGDAPTIVDLYELVLIHLTVAALTLNTSEFPILESLLLESVLQQNIWTGLLSIDLWCILGRYGTSELCYNQLKFLSNIYKRISCNLNRPEKLFLSLLIYRLFPLLSVTHQIQFYEQYPVFENNIPLWYAIGLDKVPHTIRNDIYDQIIERSSHAMKNFLNTSSNSVDDFLLLCDMLQVISTIPDNYLLNNNTLVMAIISLWENLNIKTIINLCSTKNTEHIQHSSTIVNNKTVVEKIIVIEYYFQSLCQITSHVITKCLNTDQIYVILKCLIDIFESSEHNCYNIDKISNIKTSILLILKSLATIRLNSTNQKENILNIISKMFTNLLLDTNLFIKQLTFETFNYFAHTTPYESIVKNTVGVNMTLQQEFVNYVQKIPVEGSMKCMEYLKLQQEYFNKTLITEIKDSTTQEDDENVEPISKKIHIDLNPVINRICNDVETLINTKDKLLTIENQTRIRKIIDNLSTIV